MTRYTTFWLTYSLNGGVPKPEIVGIMPYFFYFAVFMFFRTWAMSLFIELHTFCQPKQFLGEGYSVVLQARNLLHRTLLR